MIITHKVTMQLVAKLTH